MFFWAERWFWKTERLFWMRDVRGFTSPISFRVRLKLQVPPTISLEINPLVKNQTRHFSHLAFSLAGPNQHCQILSTHHWKKVLFSIEPRAKFAFCWGKKKTFASSKIYGIVKGRKRFAQVWKCTLFSAVATERWRKGYDGHLPLIWTFDAFLFICRKDSNTTKMPLPFARLHMHAQHLDRYLRMMPVALSSALLWGLVFKCTEQT